MVDENILDLIQTQKSLFLATLDPQGMPFASTTPFAVTADGSQFIVLLSDLSAHGLHLMENPVASVLICRDEANTSQLFARNRMQLSVTAQHVTDLDQRSNLMCIMQSRHGAVIEMLSSMPDFRVFLLQPNQARYVEGFGKAFTKSSFESMQAIHEGFTARSS